MHKYLIIVLKRSLFSIFHADNTSNSNFFMLRPQSQTANQICRSHKNDEFDWSFYLVTVTWRNNFVTSDPVFSIFNANSVFSMFYTPRFEFFDVTLRNSDSGTPAPYFPFNQSEVTKQHLLITVPVLHKPPCQILRGRKSEYTRHRFEWHWQDPAKNGTRGLTGERQEV